MFMMLKTCQLAISLIVISCLVATVNAIEWPSITDFTDGDTATVAGLKSIICGAKQISDSTECDTIFTNVVDGCNANSTVEYEAFESCVKEEFGITNSTVLNLMVPDYVWIEARYRFTNTVVSPREWANLICKSVQTPCNESSVSSTIVTCTSLNADSVAAGKCIEDAFGGAIDFPDEFWVLLNSSENVGLNGQTFSFPQLTSIDDAKRALCSASRMENIDECSAAFSNAVKTCDAEFPTDDEAFGKCIAEQFDAPSNLADQVPSYIWLILRYESTGSFNSGAFVSTLCGTGAQANCTVEDLSVALDDCILEIDEIIQKFALCVQSKLGISNIDVPYSFWEIISDASASGTPGVLIEYIQPEEWVDLALESVGSTWQEVCSPYQRSDTMSEQECDDLIYHATELCSEYLSRDKTRSSSFNNCFVEGLRIVYSSSPQNFVSLFSLFLFCIHFML